METEPKLEGPLHPYGKFHNFFFNPSLRNIYRLTVTFVLVVLSQTFSIILYPLLMDERRLLIWLTCRNFDS